MKTQIKCIIRYWYSQYIEIIDTTELNLFNECGWRIGVHP